MIIHKCDKCGKQVEQKSGQRDSTPSGWIAIRYGPNFSTNWIYEICGECRVKLNIPDDYRDRERDVGERLIEILSEIAQEAIQQEV